MTSRLSLLSLVLICGVASFSALAAPTSTSPAETPAGEWPQWRGPHRDGISTEKGLLRSWPRSGPPLLWKAKGLGSGYSSIVIHDGRIFTMGKVSNEQRVIALDQNGKKILWSTKVGSGG